MKVRWKGFALLLAAAVLVCGAVYFVDFLTASADSPAENLPEFQLSYDAEQFNMEEEGDICRLRPVPLATDRESILADNPYLADWSSESLEAELQRLTAAREEENNLLVQSGILIEYLPNTTPEDSAYSTQRSLDSWSLVTELEAVEALNGIGYHAMQDGSDYGQIAMQDTVFVPDSQGGCFCLTVQYRASQYALGETLWNIANTFRTDGNTSTASTAAQHRLGQVRNAAACGSTWQEAYRAILCAPQDYLTDLDYSRSLSAALGQDDPYVYLGVYDFDGDNVPELIFGDRTTVAIFGYADGQAKKLGELCDTESTWCINGLTFESGILHAECDGSETSTHIYFGHVDGEYQLGLSSNMSTERITINGESVSREALERTFPIASENYRALLRRTYSDGTWQIETEDGNSICVNENFDFSSFAWE